MIMTRSRMLVAALGSLTLLASHGAVAGTPQDVAKADILIQQRQWEEACSLLEARFGRETADLPALARLGECSTGLGDLDRAAAYYYRILARQADAPIIVVRLQVIEAVRAEMAGLGAGAQAGGWSGGVSLGRVLDTNANGGSSASTVDAIIGGLPLPFTLDADTRGISDSGTSLALEATYLQPLGAQYALLLRTDASATLYDTHHQFDRQRVGLAAALMRQDQYLLWGIQPNIGLSLTNGALDTAHAGIDTRVNLALTSGFSLTGAAGVAKRYHAHARGQDSLDGVAAAGLAFAFAPGISAGVDYVVSRVAADSALFSNWSHGPRAYLNAALTEELALSLAYSLRQSDYDGSLFMFPQGRQDSAHRVDAALEWDLSRHVMEGLSAIVDYRYSRTDSSIALYNSEGHAVSAGFSLAF